MPSSFKHEPTNLHCSRLSMPLKDRKGRLLQEKLPSWNDTSGLRNSIIHKATLAILLLVSSCCIDSVYCGQVSPSSINGLGKGSSSSSVSKENGKAVDDSELSSGHHHSHHPHHSYSGRHRHSSSKSSLHSATNYPASSVYHPEYSPLSYYPEAYYEPRYPERPSREFSARSTSYPAIAAAASSQVGFQDTEYGGLALATGHGGHHGGHHDGGHSGGHGHGHYTTYHKTINKFDQSSLGLLGLLGLLSLLSNVLRLLTTTMSTTTMMGRRRKRDTMIVKVDDNDSVAPRESLLEQLSHRILPSLNIVGHAKDGRIPLNCTYQEVCKTNKILVELFGEAEGRPVASVMSAAITRLLIDNKTKRKNIARIIRNRHYQTTDDRFVIDKKVLVGAGVAGRNGADCEAVFPTCEALDDRNEGSYISNRVGSRGPFKLPLLVSPERALALILGHGG